jgi:HK97 family phage portal protein
MPLRSRIAKALGFALAGEVATQAVLTAAAARRLTDVDASRALTLSTVYRGIQIHATSVSQITMHGKRNGLRIPVASTPALIRRPSLLDGWSRRAFIEYTVTCLFLDGNAFWMINRLDGQVVSVDALDPTEVGVIVRRDTFGVDHKSFSYRGKEYTTRDIRHLMLLRIPGMHRGLGPIQAATIEVRGALDARDYGSMWLSDANMPDGVLTTDQELKPGQADAYRNVWYGRNPDGSEVHDADGKPVSKNQRERLRVLGKGLSYAPLLLKPSDIQFLETQQFSTVQIARLMGAPASLMLITLEGDSKSYQNVEQEWIAYTRFTLMRPLNEIEDAFTDLLPGRIEAEFDVDTLSRSDTLTRMQGYNVAIQAGVMTDDEAREREGLPPLTDAQRAQIANRKTTAPTPQPQPEQEPAK